MTAGSRPLAAWAAIWGGLGLLFCAFAAHGVDDPTRAIWLRLGGFCMLVHAVMAITTLNLVGIRGVRLVAILFLVGSGIFAGTLAAMTFGAPHWLGAVTPFGGLTMLSAWFMLAWLFLRQEESGGKPPP